jgi:hypothetical protein
MDHQTELRLIQECAGWRDRAKKAEREAARFRKDRDDTIKLFRFLNQDDRDRCAGIIKQKRKHILKLQRVLEAAEAYLDVMEAGHVYAVERQALIDAIAAAKEAEETDA